MPDYPPPTSDIPRLPPRKQTAHKGDAGRVAIIAGSRGMSGAAVLCGLGALRGGAGSVRVLSPQSVSPIIAAGEPCFMTGTLREDENGRATSKAFLDLEDEVRWSHVIAIGPGLGQSEGVSELVNAVFQIVRGPLVMDADALNGAAAFPNWDVKWWRDRQAADLPGQASLLKPPTIVTPHPGEMRRLWNAAGLDGAYITDEDENRLRIAWEFAKTTDTIVVLKGHRTVVATMDRTFINTSGNPGMAAGGMGDVLTGLIAALLAQGMGGFEACCLAVHVHGRAGDMLAERIGPRGFLAREVADTLPTALADATRPPLGFHT